LDQHVQLGSADVPLFQLAELRQALKSMKNRKSADHFGIVVEMFKHLSDTSLNLLLEIYNGMKQTGIIDPTWQQTLFSMLPKSGDVTSVNNWRPIAVLRITYKLFSRLLYQRLRTKLDLCQSPDQVGFRPERSVDDAFIVYETMYSKHLEWNLPMWCASIDLKKTFDRIESMPLFNALMEQNVEPGYISLLASIYCKQQGQVKGSGTFRIQRGVKQGDVISPMLLNVGLEMAIRRWKTKFGNQGIRIDFGERPTNMRYADDLIIYASSSDDNVRYASVHLD